MTKYSNSYIRDGRTNAYGRSRNLSNSYLAAQRLGPVSSVLIIFALVSLLGLLYLNQVKKTGELNLQLQDLRQKRELLVQDNQALEVQSLRMRSLSSIQQSADEFDLVEPSSIQRSAAVGNL